MEIKCSRRLFLGKRGFTLIELLVVVLIIGVLAAVALPQYNKAVYKAQATEVLTAVNSLEKGVSAYYLEHGNYGDSVHAMNNDTLNVDVPILKHFKYNDSYNSSYDFQYGSSYGNYWSIHLKNDAISVFLEWQKGKLITKSCSSAGDKEHPNCSDYFPYCSAAEYKEVCCPPGSAWISTCDLR